MNPKIPLPPTNDKNPFRDSWRPSDKAAEAAADDPSEFETTVPGEDADGPILDQPGKSIGEPTPGKPRA